jgi:cell division cycle 2-like protein
MEYMEHDLKVLLGSMKQPFGQSEVKLLMKQLLEAIGCMHEHWVLHRDLKTSNLLYGNNGTLKVITFSITLPLPYVPSLFRSLLIVCIGPFQQVCDFGLARKYESPIGNYTPLVVTLWYRAPGNHH